MFIKPVYEVVKVLKDKIFIVGLGDPRISDNIEFVKDELNKIYPNKRIIFIDELFVDLEWGEIVEVDVDVDDPDDDEIAFTIYHGKIPKIKVWDKIIFARS